LLFTMSRTQASGAYLGGIGAMLEGVDVCPSCGLGHPLPDLSSDEAEARGCPRVVLGSFPVLTEPEITMSDLVPASRRIVEYEAPTHPLIPAISLGNVPISRRDLERGARGRGLSMPWLPPPDLGEVI
jgi:hypothetical protein